MQRLFRLLMAARPMNTLYADTGLAASRLFFGLTMALCHGLKKIPPSEKWIAYVGELGFPLSEVFAWSAGIAEFVGGLLIAIGLFTRISSIFLMFTMFVAVFIGHAGDPFSKQELGLCYLFASLLFLSLGGGRFSIDHLIYSNKAGSE